MITIQTKTIEDAARFWIQRDFSMIPGTLIERAYKDDPEGLQLLAGGSRKSDCCDAEVSRQPDSADLPDPTHGDRPDPDDDGKVTVCDSCERTCSTHWGGAKYGYPAAHTMMFCPNDSIDENWIRDNAETIADTCGFLVYESDETGIVLGIDGGGYDFYDAHWIPLYKLRGFEWHDTTPAAPPAAPKRAARKAPGKARKAPSKGAKRSKRAS